MFGVHSGVAFHAPVRAHGAVAVPGAGTRARSLALLASGRRQGPITRLVTPWSIGELTTPFVFLDYAEAAPGSEPLVGIQPRSGIATLTVVLDGQVSFGDASGAHGEVNAGGFIWMHAPRAVWRGDGAEQPLRVFQLWISLTEAQRIAAAASQGIGPHCVEEQGPVRVILGRFFRARSPLRGAPADINFFHVRLRNREYWRYAAPEEHNVTWLAVDRGGLKLKEGALVCREQIGVFGDSAGLIEVQADGDTSFLLGSTKRDRRPLAHAGEPTGAIHAALMRRHATVAGTRGADLPLGRQLARGRQR